METKPTLIRKGEANLHVTNDLSLFGCWTHLKRNQKKNSLNHKM